MIKFILFLTFLASSSCHILLQTASGDVSRGNFIYWSLSYHGNIIIQLISLSGDTDLYVSEKISKPDYEPDKYDLHSASCGVDTVHIPSSFKRPIGIGIYGHPSNENSTYLLEIYYDDEKEGDLNNYESDMNETYQTSSQQDSDESKTRIKFTKSMLISGFWAVMEILELLFS